MSSAKETSKYSAKTGADTPQPTLPSVSLPKGGGAIRGIGEKFSANPVTGTASISVPLYTSPGRSGFGAQLSLTYDSGSGNGPFGFGWSLSLPSITRKTDKGLPRYQDANESDVFILSGAEDLVPVFKEDQDGNWACDAKGSLIFDEEERDGYVVRRFRPRIEGLFARIERWTRKIDGDIHWRSISKDNILTVYGRDEQSRISDPADKSRVFSWLICESYDDKGNAIVYEYAAENDKEIDLSQANERNRTRTANRYLKRIRYGNRKPLLLDTSKSGFRKPHTEQTDFSSAGWMFEVVFDYDEDHYRLLPFDSARSVDEQHQYTLASATTAGTWSSRPDPFSVYRAGFEVRTYRRCQRVMMFHCFPELGSEPCLVRSTEFNYLDLDCAESTAVENELKHKGSTRFASFIQEVTQSGYVHDENKQAVLLNGFKYLTYLEKSLPPLEFEYSQATIQNEIKEVGAESLTNLPYGLDGVRYQLVDLDGEGLPGILTEHGDTWFYKPNLGGGRFGALEKVASKPSIVSLNSGRIQLMDLAGDGQLDVVDLNPPVSGFYERTNDQCWENFRPFTSIPNISWRDPNLKFIDLTGDGHADVLITENEVFTWHPSLAEEGFGPAVKVYKALNEEKGPRLVFDDGTESIYLADMSGDGLVDLARIRNGEVCYWPNLGYGCFGAKVTMDNAPWFDDSDQFDQKRIRLADVDGSGVTDIIYLGHDGVRIYFNHSGNSWSSAQTLFAFPHIDNLSSIQVADLFGKGTTCLIWSSPLPGDASKPMRYINLTGEQKPHLLVSSKNNLGAETRIHYASSTKFYLADKAAGKPWITRLPFPVRVVERVETYDYIGCNRFVTCYKYHHGFFDGVEREFRGFGMVEQWDTEEINFDPSQKAENNTNWNAASFVPPALTRTWFHTGAYFENGVVSKHFEDEYYHEGDPSLGEGELTDEELEAMLLPDTILPDGLTAEEARQAYRALKGSILRYEIYALDCKPDLSPAEESNRPYIASERNYIIKCLQPQGDNKHAVFFVHPRETVDFHYERKLHDFTAIGQVAKRADPRVTHNVTIEVDDYGNILKSIAIGYGRRQPDKYLPKGDQDKQTQTLITYTENLYTNPIGVLIPQRSPGDIEKDAYRVPLQSETRTFELINVNWQALETLLKRLNMSMPPSLPGITNLFPFYALQTLAETYKFLQGEWDIPYDDINHVQATTDNPYRRLVEHIRTVFRKNSLMGALSLGQLESLALPYQNFRLAFTKDLVRKGYVDSGKLSETELNRVMRNEGGYVHSEADTNWWVPSGQILYSANANDTAEQELDSASEHFFLPMRFQDPFGNVTALVYDDYDLLLIETYDPLENMVHSENDYRILSPRLISDSNENRSEVAFDTLGMVVGTAVMGKASENKGDLLTTDFKRDLVNAQILKIVQSPNPFLNFGEFLDKATTRVVYDLFAYKRTQNDPQPEPAAVCTLVRETHNSDLIDGEQTKIQCSFSYSDGFGREIQKKIQAEPGLVGGDQTDPRWVGSGWTLYNNKGKPVRRYEPFFSKIHRFEFAKTVGVSSILFYDSVERVVATLHPNDTFEKVVFDPWHQETYDANDNVISDPRKDVNISDYVRRYFNQIEPQSKAWKTWLQQRDIDPADPPEDVPRLDPEKKAAIRTLPHANTPILTFFDSLGRVFLNVTQNASFGVIGGKYHTWVILDIEGNEREIHDEKRNNQNNLEERVVMRNDYDMLGKRIKQANMEAGTRWMLNNVLGKPIRQWDSRGFVQRLTYDALLRPIELFVTAANGTEHLAEKIEYGESNPDPEKNNHRLKTWKIYDGSGVLIKDSYDFKGNLKVNKRQLLPSPYHKDQIDWTQNPLPDETFTSITRYDALNRPIQIVAPHSDKVGTKLSVTQPVYNEANLLERVDVWLEQETEPNGLLGPNSDGQHIIKNIDYNAKGQRELIQYGNDVRTSYDYNTLTFRLIHLQSWRDTDKLQNLFYSYDPVGNITYVRDDSQQTIYFKGHVVRPDAEYTYDAVYRLIKADGREHRGQISQPQTTWDDGFRIGLAHPNDGEKMRNYFELYKYDEVGNILRCDHKADNGNWVRTYDYSEDSLLENGRKSNRVSRTVIHPNSDQPITEPYTYDPHGNMTSMPHLKQMDWNFKDQLQMVDKGGGCKVYYVYDATGQRVRKVKEQDDKPIEERIYLGGVETYRKYNGNGTIKLERETLHIMDDKQRVAFVDTKTFPQNGGTRLSETLIRYQFVNHVGSAILELDENADEISYEEYYPYGCTSYQAVRSKQPSSVEVNTKRYRYTGKERDEETGLYYHGARYLAPWLRRWVSVDPLLHSVNGQSENLRSSQANGFSAFNNNPIRNIDEDGRSAEDTALAVAKIGKAAISTIRKEGDLNQETIIVPNIYSEDPSLLKQRVNEWLGRLELEPLTQKKPYSNYRWIEDDLSHILNLRDIEKDITGIPMFKMTVSPSTVKEKLAPFADLVVYTIAQVVKARSGPKGVKYQETKKEAWPYLSSRQKNMLGLDFESQLFTLAFDINETAKAIGKEGLYTFYNKLKIAKSLQQYIDLQAQYTSFLEHYPKNPESVPEPL